MIIRRNVLIKSLILMLLIFMGYSIGHFSNIDWIALLVYSLFLLDMYMNEKRFFLKHIYMVVMSMLFVVGVFVCDCFELELFEISQKSGYSNALWLAVFSYVTFFIALSCTDRSLNQYTIQKKRDIQIFGMDAGALVMWVIIVLEIYSALVMVQMGSNSALGASRFEYSEKLPRLVNIVKGNIVPIFAIWLASQSKYRKTQSILFLGLSLFILLWSGNKFGSFFLLVYLFILARHDVIKIKNIKKYVWLVGIAFCLLLGVVYVQYKLLYKYTVSDFIEYLGARLAQQGQVWWAVFTTAKEEPLALSDFAYELKSCFSDTMAQTYPYAGQWKMMDLASRGSATIRYRIETGVPLTATTQASLYYYFGTTGIAFAFPVLGGLYGFLLHRLYEAIKNSAVISAFFYTRAFQLVNYLLGASALQSVLSWDGVFTIIIIIFLENLRKKKKRIAIR